ncbi:SMC-Scp complex subunit ScpB [Candidatus Uhrbacteria bacterium]|nr:SMC-Scp complex subunit ScpB [Candidatus Uhrbacteria bacterium]
MTLERNLEAVLFASAKPYTIARLAQMFDVASEDIQNALNTLSERLEQSGSALQLQKNGQEFELTTRSDCADAVSKAVQVEAQAELSRPALEALTILAYRGPMTRPELEQIRGVQSSMILRNLLLRGLIEQKEDTRLGQAVYAITFDFLNHLGLSSVEALPDYEALRSHTSIQDVLKQLEEVPVQSHSVSDSTELSV